MKTILFLNDYSAEAEHALAYTLILASSLKARILVWNLKEQSQNDFEAVMVSAFESTGRVGQLNWIEKSKSRISLLEEEQPITTLSELDILTKSIHEIVTSHNIELIIKGVAGPFKAAVEGLRSILTKTYCPVLLISEDVQLRVPKHSVYLTDLRFCRHDVIRFLKRFKAEPSGQLSIAHLCYRGLPNLDEKYALTLFEDSVGLNHPNCNVTLTYIKDNDVHVATDVLVNMLNADLLALTYSGFHFRALTFENISQIVFRSLTIPILIFPS